MTGGWTAAGGVHGLVDGCAGDDEAGAALLDHLDEAPGLDAVAVGRLGPPLLPVHPDHAELVEAVGDGLEDVPVWPISRFDADARRWARPRSSRRASGRRPAKNATTTPTNASHWMARPTSRNARTAATAAPMANGRQEERAGDGQLADGEDHRRHQPDPAPGLGGVHRARQPF